MINTVIINSENFKVPYCVDPLNYFTLVEFEIIKNEIIKMDKEKYFKAKNIPILNYKIDFFKDTNLSFILLDLFDKFKNKTQKFQITFYKESNQFIMRLSTNEFDENSRLMITNVTYK